MAKIINVSISENKYRVIYESGAERYYPLDNPPKTVLAKLAETEKETEETPVREFCAPVVVAPAPVVAVQPVKANEVTTWLEVVISLLIFSLNWLTDMYYDVTTVLLIKYDKGVIIWKYDILPMLRVYFRKLRRNLKIYWPVLREWVCKGTVILIADAVSAWNFRKELMEV